MDETDGVSVPGALKLDHLHPYKPILLMQFLICLTFILSSQSLLSQRVNSEKREFSQLQQWMGQMGFQCPGHSNWTICTPLSPFYSSSLNFPVGGQFLLSQRASQYWGKGNFQLQKWLRQGFQCTANSNLSIYNHFNQFRNADLPLFNFIYGSAHSLILILE